MARSSCARATAKARPLLLVQLARQPQPTSVQYGRRLAATSGASRDQLSCFPPVTAAFHPADQSRVPVAGCQRYSVLRILSSQDLS